MRWLCLDLIATLVQNNPYCQEAVIQAEMLPKMLEMLDKDCDATVKTKALYAVSCKSYFCISDQSKKTCFTPIKLIFLE